MLDGAAQDADPESAAKEPGHAYRRRLPPAPRAVVGGTRPAADDRPPGAWRSDAPGLSRQLLAGPDQPRRRLSRLPAGPQGRARQAAPPRPGAQIGAGSARRRDARAGLVRRPI